MEWMDLSLCGLCVFDLTWENECMITVNDFAQFCVKNVSVWPFRNDGLLKASEIMD